VADVFLAERVRLLGEGNLMQANVRALEEAGESDAALDVWEQVFELTSRYCDLLPEEPVARCPRSGALVRWPIETAGLHGWFWDVDAPARRTPDPLPPAWLAMTGAVRLDQPVERFAFICRPGPGIPFVVPRIIEQPGVQAVVAQVPIGRHTGWAISYFGPRPEGVPLVNLWGTETYPVYDDEGTWRGWANAIPKAEDYDFDLERWLRAGKLLWIEPGDDSATLREGLDGCPYAGLDGVRKNQFVQNGKVWHSEL
jgi:hypothetical protein